MPIPQVAAFSNDANNGGQQPQLSQASTSVVSASTAGIRAVIYQITSLYLRTPAKIFRPSRFDFLVTVRILEAENLRKKPYSILSHSSAALLYNAILKNGWKIIPDQILPPLLLNSATGVVLYTTYLSSLQYFNGFNLYLHSPSPIDTFRAGFLAGAIQSIISAPIDAIYARSSAAEILKGEHENLWRYGLYKLKQIGPIGVFAGFGFSFIKDSFGFGFYFSIFEIIKNQGYSLTKSIINTIDNYKSKLLHTSKNEDIKHSKSTKILHTTFILLAGASAAFGLIGVQFPISKIQKIHLSRLEALDIYNAKNFGVRNKFFKIYYKSYIDTIIQVDNIITRSKTSFFQWSYKGFLASALTTIPATSVCLLVFEILRQKLGDEFEEASLQP
ncbi:hypothetical protein PACTADRAFT_32604 [Pachysolen tannophilus NRRL Y-2460]|uniref:Mitochondrial carrier protein n=1 Tax=Pachysolen tannophilus NRRL Y-2460 TaxID=669874 RepID=A0A1E4TZD8_PACTA|nr:hypothetical protein PACTADRAFT_32604 [Pachysolen tannophilus NRRL Y-2460]